ncbi:MAG: PleD family two-component system response regulator [Phyllobacteriaceae bacterium]|jgi:two-component system cell cycle response regulator|nr:PleD family two-component system response regulator [Phyllobacteriaceae bacterium]
MTARVLVVDDIMANVRLLEAKLSAEYFEVVTAMNGLDALDAVQKSKPDIVLLDVMMPGIDGIEVCKRIKSNPETQHIPVVMVTALDQPEDRVRGLEAGADDFLTKPVNDISLFCRIKSLVRLKMLTDELRVRSPSVENPSPLMQGDDQLSRKPGNVLLVDGHASSADRMIAAMAEKCRIAVASNPAEALERVAAAEVPFELIVVSFDQSAFDGLRLCSQLRSGDATRQTPLMIIVNPDEQKTLLRALDMGVNDYLLRPVDRLEIQARASTQVRRWRYTEQLRNSVKASIEMAITDALTGLYNRRYLETHLNHMIDHYVNRGKVLSVLAVDVDFFKAINDTHGHDAGDKVLQELAGRLREHTRSIDLCCRIGGEEFIVVLPNTDPATAEKIGERLRRAVASKSFAIGSTSPVPVTISAGLASLAGMEDTLEKLLKRADSALYRAKREGRNRVVKAGLVA